MAPKSELLHPIGSTGKLYAYSKASNGHVNTFLDNELIKISKEWSDPAFFAHFYQSKGRVLRRSNFYGKRLKLRAAATLHFEFYLRLLKQLRTKTMSNNKNDIHALFRQSFTNNPVVRRGKLKLKLKTTISPKTNKHTWLRLYAVRIAGGAIVFIGGAIKFGRTIRE